jgi:uncharacterized membrane protein
MIVILLLIVSIGVSGCLVVDNSTVFTSEDKAQTKIEAEELTHDFFSYNEYDSTSSNPGYEPDELISMFKETTSGDVVTIDPICILNTANLIVS